MNYFEGVGDSIKRVVQSPLTYCLLGLVTICVLTLGRYNLWGDEAFSAAASLKSIERIIQIAAGDTNPPLYHIVLKYWGLFFNHNMIWIRLLSVFWYAIAIIAVYHTAFRIFSSKIWSTLATLLFGLNPVVLFFAQEVRYYAMNYALLALLGWVIVYIYNTSRVQISRWIWVCWALILIAGLYTHSTFIFIFPISGLVAGLRYVIPWWKKYKTSKSKNYTDLIQELVPLFISSVVVFIAYTPWLPVILNQNSDLSESFWITFDPWASVQDQLSNLFTGAVYPQRGPVWVGIRLILEYLGVGGLLFGIYQGFRHEKARPLAYVVALFCVIAFFVSFNTPVFYVRYLSVLLPLVAILIVYGVYKLIPRISQKIAISLLAVFSFLSGVWYYGLIISNEDFKPSYNQIADAIIEDIEEGSTIIYPNMSNYSGSLYYLRNYDYTQRFWDPTRQEPKWAGISMVEEEKYITTEDVLTMDTVYVSYEGNGNSIEDVLRDNGYTNTKTYILDKQGFYIWER